MTTLTVFNTLDELASAIARQTVDDLNDALYTHGTAVWCIAGGSTPMAAYDVIASEMMHEVDWSKVYIIIGDERCVPLESHDSSWRQADTILLRHIRHSHRLMRPKSNLSAEETAAQYQETLRRLPLAHGATPRIDVLWLGIGEDGHTLSLFPGHPSLDETNRLVIPVHDSPKPPPDRISLSLHALTGVVASYVLAAGAGKQQVIQQVLEHDTQLPIVLATDTIATSGGTVSWFIDAAAAPEHHSHHNDE